MNPTPWVSLIVVGFAITPVAAQTHHHAHHAHSGVTTIPTGIVFTAPVVSPLSYSSYSPYFGGYSGTVAYPPLNYNTLSWPLSGVSNSYLPGYSLPYFSSVGVYPSLLQAYPYQSQYTSPSLILRAAPGNMPGGTFMLPPFTNPSTSRSQTSSSSDKATEAPKNDPPPVLLESPGLRITIITPGSSSNTPTPLPSYSSR